MGGMDYTSHSPSSTLGLSTLTTPYSYQLQPVLPIMTFLSLSSVLAAFMIWLAYYVYELIMTKKRSDMQVLAYPVCCFITLPARLSQCPSLPIVLPSLALGT